MSVPTAQRSALPTSSRCVPAKSISEFLAISGLTVEQVGRLLGVSRRSVQRWIAGEAMAAEHQERVAQLESVVLGLSGSVDERRAALLDSSNGESPFRKLLAEAPQQVTLQFRSLTVADRISF